MNFEGANYNTVPSSYLRLEMVETTSAREQSPHPTVAASRSPEKTKLLLDCPGWEGIFCGLYTPIPKTS
jgi:hypothetical protein